MDTDVKDNLQSHREPQDATGRKATDDTAERDAGTQPGRHLETGGKVRRIGPSASELESRCGRWWIMLIHGQSHVLFSRRDFKREVVDPKTKKKTEADDWEYRRRFEGSLEECKSFASNHTDSHRQAIEWN